MMEALANGSIEHAAVDHYSFHHSPDLLPANLQFEVVDTPEVAIAIPEGRLAEVRRAAAVEVALWAEPERRYRGRLREVAAVADPASRTYAARVAIDDARATWLSVWCATQPSRAV